MRPVAARAQLPSAPLPEPATLSGDVVDSHDALVPGARIVASEIAATKKEAKDALKSDTAAGVAAADDTSSQAAAHTAVSDASGHFEISGLTPGVWKITVTAPELATFVSRPIALKPGESFAVQGIVLPIAEQYANVTVTVTMRQVADMEIHDQEKQRVLAIFPNYGVSYVWNAAPLDAKQKFALSAHATLDPVSFATAAITAGFEQINNTYPSYGHGPAGYGRRYGSAWGTVFIGHNLSYAVMPSIFRQDPRYFYMGSGTIKQRAIHAISSAILCRGDDGHTQFNASYISGTFAAGYISHAYRPDTTGGLRLAADNTLIGIAGTAGVNILREFFFKHFSHGTPVYGKGKPPAEAVKATAQ